LYFQAKGESKKISLLSLDRKGNKWFISIFFENGKNISKEKVIDAEEESSLKERFLDFEIKKNLENVDFVENFFKLKKNFKILKRIKAIEY
jgi:hypothetical protein